jgi:TonB-linked SusC/RagA family outer membrane protein
VDDFRSWDPRHGDGRGAAGSAAQTFNPVYRWNWQNTLNYQTSINDVHNINLTLGTEYQKTTFYNFSASATGFSDRFYMQENLISGSFQNQFAAGGFAERGFDSYFGRLNYNFNGKYLLSVTLRNDGISDLHPDNRRGTFPGGSIGWRVSDEPFFTSKLITDLKLRASYAELGNVDIGTLAYAGGYSPVLYGPNAGIAFTQVSNRNLQWETSRKFNVGLNMTIGKVTLEADYFTTNIDDMVLDAPVAPSLGVPGGNFGIIAQNVGSMENKGVELRIGALVVQRGDFAWNTDFNFTYIKNEVTNLISPLTNTYNRTEVGRSIGELYGFEWAGVNSENGNPLYYKSDGSIVQYNLTPVLPQRGWKAYDPGNPGDVSVAAVSLGTADLDFLGNTLPKWFGGWTNQFSYKNFHLEIFFRYSGGNYIMNETHRGSLGQGFSNNQRSILDRWIEAGQSTDMPKLFSGQDANIWQTGASNSRFVEKGDFLRVQNIILGYSIPSSALQSLFNDAIRSVKIFAQVQNPIVFTSYSGLDPEMNQFNDQRQFGVDWNTAPIIRTWTAGLNLGF